MKKGEAIGIGLLWVLLVTAGCQIVPPGFSQTAGNIGSAFAAAETTLRYAHEGKITYAYAASSFASYQSELSGNDQTLVSAQGAPSSASMHSLLALYQEAMQVVNAPCLSAACNWQRQVASLDRASQAFLKAGNA